MVTQLLLRSSLPVESISERAEFNFSKRIFKQASTEAPGLGRPDNGGPLKCAQQRIEAEART